jgi:ubiquinone/menaquinone biosynthesis C-methylase UbiE
MQPEVDNKTEDINAKPREEIITTTMIGGGDYEIVGKEFFRFFLDFGHLKPDDRVLDVGCGLGRMAMPLTTYLRDGSYEGFDIVAESINWCKKNISSKYPSFQFQLSDIYNKQYNPAGRYKALEYQFPYEDASFDFVFLTSVFTHMFPLDVEHYMNEIRRVLKKQGRSFITYFLLNEESLRLISDGQSREDFKHNLGQFRTADNNIPEHCIAYDEAFIIKLYNNCRLEIKHPILYGLWCGRKLFTSYQDIIISIKE